MPAEKAESIKGRKASSPTKEKARRCNLKLKKKERALISLAVAGNIDSRAV